MHFLLTYEDGYYIIDTIFSNTWYLYAHFYGHA